MLSILASGTLVRDPQERTSAAGKPYCTVLMRAPVDGDEALLCSLIAFQPDAVRALLALAKGDTVAIAGRAKLSSWERDGEQRHGLSVTVEQVLTVYQVDKRRKASRPAEEPEHAS